MIQWIALALAADAESKASNAQEKATEANYRVGSAGSPMVIVRPVEMESVPKREPTGFWDHFFLPYKKVLAKKPTAVISLKKSDILNLREYADEDGTPYVRLGISEYAQIWINGELRIGLYVPGTIEQVAGAIGGL